MGCIIKYKGQSILEEQFLQYLNKQIAINNLFNENENLANAVYEALGFNDNNFELKENKEAFGKEPHPEGATTYDIFSNDRKIGKIALFDGKNPMIKGLNLNESERNKGLGKALYKWLNYKATLKGGRLYADQEFISLDAQRVWESLNKEGLVDLTGNSPKFNDKQKQQALQLYSQYLDTIFPDSEVKDIVYHGADEKIESFTLDKKKNKEEKGLFFFGKKQSAQLWRDASFEETNTEQGDLIYALLNITNPETVNFEDKSAWDMAKYANESIKGDGLIATNVDEMYVGRDTQYVAFEPEQIHRLGSKQDIEGFKNFVTQPSTSVEKFSYARAANNSYEVSTEGDKRFSALNAKLKDGRTIEEAYQLDVKGYRKYKPGEKVDARTAGEFTSEDKNGKEIILDSSKATFVKEDTQDPSAVYINIQGEEYSVSKREIIPINPSDKNWKNGKGKKPLHGYSEEDNYLFYKDLWSQWAKENPSLLEDLRQKAQGKVLTDKFASSPVSQARALADILNETTSTTQSSTSVKGINIYTKSTDKLGKELTNPNWGAKNIMDIEAEYKANASKIKAPNLNAEEALRYDMNLMYKLQMKKFKAHPELVKEITDRGGVAFLEASTHTKNDGTPITKGSRWEGKGINSNFIKVLIKSYKDSLGTTQSSTSVKEFDIADNLTPIEQNFADGQGGRQMQDKFKGKSTMDLIISGDRTRTTRAKTDIQRMAKDYNLSKISDLVGKVIRMTDKTGKQVYTRITKVAPFTQEYQDATWQKEGWVKSVTDKNVGDYPYAIEFKVVNKPTIQPSPTEVVPTVSVENTFKTKIDYNRFIPNTSSQTMERYNKYKELSSELTEQEFNSLESEEQQTILEQLKNCK